MTDRSREHAARATLFGYGSVGIGLATTLMVLQPPVTRIAALRALYAFLHVVALGLPALLALSVRDRLRSRIARWGAAFLAVVGFCAFIVAPDVAPFARRVTPSFAWVTIGAGTVLGALGAMAAWRVGAALRRWWLLPMTLGALAGAAEPWVLGGLYPGLHLYGLWVAGLFASSALLCRERSRAQAGLAVLALAALASVVMPPSAGVRSALARGGGALVPLLPWSAPRVAHVTIPTDAWFRPSAEREAVPPSDVDRPVEEPLVVLLSIDALRYDLLHRMDTRRHVPNLLALREEGLELTNAYAPGSMTVNTLTSLFSGTHFSQQRWEEGTRWHHLWPLNDPTPRFPEALSRAGVRTIHVPGTDWMVDEFGVVRGFSEERYRPSDEPRDGSRRWNHSDDSLPRMVERLRSLEPGEPAFLFAHWLDPHAPYTRGESEGDTPFQRYLGEVEHMDRHLGELRNAIEELGLAERTYLFIISDHGEGFDDRDGKKRHGYGLYEELIRVPLLVDGPGVVNGRENRLVSLMDLGPTILDLFAQPTPPHVVGESLLPWLLGERATLTRPVLAETKLKRALVLPSGLKVIRDVHLGTLEVYDLRTDPDERVDRVDDMTPAMEAAVARLDRFFEVHQLREGGYEPPLRP